MAMTARKRVLFAGLAARASAGALQTAAAITESLGKMIGRVTGDPALAAVRFARARLVKVVVVAQQRALAEALAAAFGRDDAVKYVNLGTAVDLRDGTIAYDGLHLVPRGNERIAGGLVTAVMT